MQKDHQVLIVDGMALLFRAFYATSYRGYIRKTSSGIPTNALYGFILYLFDAIKLVQPKQIICCWDMGRNTFRNEWYAPYKANRTEPPEALVPQFEAIKEVTSSLDIPNLGVIGYEADDCIGTISEKIIQSSPSHVVILSGDHDLLQLLTKQISVMIMNKGKSNYTTYTPELMLIDKGITPEQLTDLKGFMGDVSDNYPGVKGIGEKIALNLIKSYHNIEGVIQHIELLPDGVRTKILNQLDMLYLSKKLATIRKDVPIEFQWNNQSWQFDYAKSEPILQKYQLEDLKKVIFN